MLLKYYEIFLGNGKPFAAPNNQMMHLFPSYRKTIKITSFVAPLNMFRELMGNRKCAEMPYIPFVLFQKTFSAFIQ